MIIDFTKFGFIWYTVQTRSTGIEIVYYGKLLEDIILSDEKIINKGKMRMIFYFTLNRLDYIEDVKQLEFFRQHPQEFLNAVTNFQNEHGETIE